MKVKRGPKVHEEADKPESIQDANTSESSIPQPNSDMASGDKNNRVIGGGQPSWKNTRFNKLVLLAVVLLLGAAGTVYLIVSHAETSVPDADAKPTLSVAFPDPPYVPDAILLKFKTGVPQAVQDKLIARYGSVKKEIPQIGVKVITVPQEARDAVIEALSHNPAIDFAEKDAYIKAEDVTPNDPEWGAQWGLQKSQVNKAWDTTQGSTATVIAVLDTGVSTVPLDLQNKVLNTGYDFVNNDQDPTDDNWHGTSVAGVAAATTNNAIGVAGACGNCMILPVKVMDANGGGTIDTGASGITYAADHGAKIVNMSFAAYGTDRTLDSAIKYALSKGLSLYAAAGNAGSSTMVYPAASSGVVGVAGSDYNDVLYSWSDYGSWVKVAASGSDMVIFNMEADRYGTGSGTSFATPVVAGIAGLLWSAKPAATATQIQQSILNNTDPVQGTNQIGGGRVNAYKAMQAILGITTSADTTAPTTNITLPANGTTVSAQTTVSVNASDNVGVTKVELYRNGTLYATSTVSPYNFLWDTTTVPNGTYTLTAKAYDAAGNVGTSAAVSVNVSNTIGGSDSVAPVATITSPVSGAVVSGKVSVNGSATDNVGVTELDLYIDGILKTTSISGSLTYNWNTNGNSVKKGQHTITIKAYDAAGNVGTATSTVTK